MKKTLFIALFIVAALVLASGQSFAVSGHCGNCHTMHNSQNGASVNGNVDGNPVLLKWTCLGCHTTSEPDRNYDSIPRVQHTDTTDLAGGNFAYVTGGGAAGASDAHGHNVSGISSEDGALHNTPPGKGSSSFTGPLTCAGTTGCHGDRTKSGDMVAMSGAHHTNNTGFVADASDLGHSYRFLKDVKGGEVTDRENSSATNHNEYLSDATNGISKILCGACHPNFHNDGESTGAWTRHPVDIALNAGNDLSGNYGADGTTANRYDWTVPIGRTSVPAAVDNKAYAINTVMCLSCHKAHGTAYNDMLRWEYTDVRAGYDETFGCNKCHKK